MVRQRKLMVAKRNLIAAKMAVVLLAIPLILWAYEYGPDPGYSGVPKEQGTCASSACHVGTANNPANKGSVAVSFPNGTTYTPGVKQHLTVTISDPAQHAWGFQLTARLASNTGTMAGTVESPDINTLLICSDTNFGAFLPVAFSAASAQTCATKMPLQYIEHSKEGYAATKGQANSAKYQVDWTPPSTDVGDITIYVAGNAANGDVQREGDHIYTTNYKLTPAPFGGPPSVFANGVVSAGAFGGFKSAAPGSWIEIFGAGLAASSRGWEGDDFNGASAPTLLDGVKVTIGGQPAFIDFVSPGQVNAQVPSNAATGATQLAITTPSGTSPAYDITINPLQPGLLAPPSFLIGGKQYVAALFLDGTFVLPPGSIPGLTTRQAKPGDTILVYGVGFGPVNQNIPAGQIAGAATQLTNAVKMTFGGTSANLNYSGLAPGFVGLYQFNVIVPAVANNDAMPFTFTLNNVAGSQTLVTALKN